MIVSKGHDAVAILYSDIEFALRDGLPYAEFESIPEGSGILKTDLKTLWWEAIPLPEQQAPQEPAYTPEQLVQQQITELELELIGTNQYITELELMILGGPDPA